MMCCCDGYLQAELFGSLPLKKQRKKHESVCSIFFFERYDFVKLLDQLLLFIHPICFNLSSIIIRVYIHVSNYDIKSKSRLTDHMSHGTAVCKGQSACHHDDNKSDFYITLYSSSLLLLFIPVFFFPLESVNEENLWYRWDSVIWLKSIKVQVKKRFSGTFIGLRMTWRRTQVNMCSTYLINRGSDHRPAMVKVLVRILLQTGRWSAPLPPPWWAWPLAVEAPVVPF